MLVTELYSKERGVRVEFYINRQIIVSHFGGCSTEDTQLFYEKIPAIFKGSTGFLSDYWQAHAEPFGKENHWHS